MNAFLEAMEREMRGALEDSWFSFLRWMHVERYGSDLRDDEFRQQARKLAAAGEIPPWPEP